MNVDIYTHNYNELTEKQGRSTAGADDFKIEKDLLIQCGYKPGMSILDYGCGWGSLLEVINDYGSYEGVDISPFMINLAKQQFPKNNFKVSKIGDVKTIKKDIVVAHSVFTHIPKDILSEALSDVRNNIKDTGFIIIDIFYEGTGTVNYNHVEWLNLLKENNLLGVFIKSRNRNEYYVHNYYKLTKGI